LRISWRLRTDPSPLRMGPSSTSSGARAEALGNTLGTAPGRTASSGPQTERWSQPLQQFHAPIPAHGVHPSGTLFPLGLRVAASYLRYGARPYRQVWTTV